MIAGYLGTSARFDDSIARFAAAYADQTERDWQALLHSRRNAKPPSKSSRTAPAKASKPAS